MTKIIISNCVETIGNYAFYDCNQVKSITIGSGVTQIEEYAFASCSSIKSITVHAMQPPVLTSKNVFDDDAYLYTKLNVRYGCKSTYEEADEWYRFANISELESDSRFEVNDVSASRGSEFMLPISLINDIAISGLQADLYLPAGVDIDPGNENKSLMLTERATNSHVITAARQSDGAIKILAYSNKAEAFKGNDGALFTIKLNVADNFNGDCLIQLKNITLTAPDNSEYTASDLEINVEMVTPEKGDANSDGTVNISDINAVANYILQPEKSHINLTQADVAENGKVNVTDIIGIGNIILGKKAHTNAIRKSTLKTTENDYRLYIDDFDIVAGEEYKMGIMLDNTTAFSAFQADLYLPDGLSIKLTDGIYDIALSDRKDNHIVSAAQQKDGAIRIIAYSVSSKDFSGNEGELATLTLVANENFEKGNILLNNIILSRNDMTEYEQENELAKVNGGLKTEALVKLTMQNSYYNNVIFFLLPGTEQKIQIVNIDPMFVLNTVMFNDENVTEQLVDGVFTTPALEEDAVINISYDIPTAEDTPIQNSRIKAYGYRGDVVVVGCERGESIAVYDVDGILLRTIFATSDTMRIAMPTDAVYVVKVADTAVKVAL